MAANKEAFQFQAETKQLLDLMIHSLYTNKEIFLRELISNASDAIDRLRFEALTNPQMLEGDDKFEIRLEADPKARTLTLSDNGIGMSRDEVSKNIGTIAKSGTRELREMVKEGAPDAALAELIGQFGVGFYSSFMVADKVTLLTRRAGEESATLWESTGDGYYTMGEASRDKRGTSITLHLKPQDPENGIEDFTDKWILSRIVKRHSDFVSYPIIYKDEREEIAENQEGESQKDAPPTIVIEDKILNSMRPIWTRSPEEVSESEYAEFYKHISHDWTEPLKTVSLKAEGRFEYQALLFIPSKAPYDLYYHGAECGLRLYAKRVMIMERCEDLLPRYLRFVKGIVDSADLPLNISRQMLQQDRHITQIRKWLTKKALSVLEEMYEKESDKYLSLWREFGKALKEGAGSDYENKDKIVSILLFESSNDPEKFTTLKEYVERMKEDQNEIFYLTGESRSVVENSPHLEAFKAKGYEVLFLVDSVDELLMQSLTEFDGKKLKSIGKGRVKLGDDDEQELKKQEEEVAGLLEFLQKKLDQYVKQVRLTNRLTVSPVCLVVEEHDYSPQLERILQKGKGGGPKQRRVLELNPGHHIFTRMFDRYQADNNDPRLSEYAELLFGYALLAEGSELPDPVRFNSLLAELMVQNL
jgi:molecular chaperone HtpG